MIRRGITITVERGPGLDENGDPVDDEPTTHTIANCAVAPRLASEVEERGRQGSVVGLTLYAPPGSDLLHTDIIIIASGDPNPGRYAVEGEAGQWKSPFSGHDFGFEVALRRAEG